MLPPLTDKVARQPVHAEVVGHDGARCPLHDHDHVVGYESLSVVECEPCGTPNPATPLEPGSEDVVERRGAFRRAVGETGRPVRPRELPPSMVETEVDDAHHRRTIVSVAAACDGLEGVVSSSRAPRAGPPGGPRGDVEIARGDAPSGLHDVPGDRRDRLRLPIALVGSIGGDDAHRWDVCCASSMAKIDGYRHGPGIIERRAARAGLPLEPRKQEPPGRSSESVRTQSDRSSPWVEVVAIPRHTEPCEKTPRMSRVAQGAVDLVED